ncbi:MAG: hypothetical protein ACYC7E_16565 [Armatimonadota bacterium]
MMECPQCGYVMDDFQTTCPRCARMGVTNVAVAEREKVIAPGDDVPAETSVRTFQREAPIRFVPTQGWPLYIALWIVILLNGYLVTLNVCAYFDVNLPGMAPLSDRKAFFLMLFPGFFPAVRLISAIGMLRAQQWGFYVFCVFSVIPAVLTLMSGVKAFTPREMILNVIPAIVVFFLALARWQDFD